MISRAELQRLANREKVALGTLEKDYVLTEVLKALSRIPELIKLFIFKGGTALRKVYFPGWRYSEDLDFTVKHDMTKEELRETLEKWYGQAKQMSQVQLATKMLHKPDGYACVRTQFVGPLSFPGMIFMDLSFDEPLCLEPQHRKVLTSPFPDKGQYHVLSYPLEELLAEKMRSLVERGKSRDYYDVWKLLKEQSDEIDPKLLGTVLLKKLSHKGLNLHDTSDVLPADINELKRHWEDDLGRQVSSLPQLDEVIQELHDMLDKFGGPHLMFQA